MKFLIQPSQCLQGVIRVPGDKSISHRAAIFAGLASGTSTIKGFLRAEDTLATLHAMEQLGASVTHGEDGVLSVDGVGINNLSAPKGLIDCGNSGTAMRLLAGVLAGTDFASSLIGDASLSKRPMRRVIDPLTQMGADITANAGHAPLKLRGQPLKAIDYRTPMASAQVKSCCLLAALRASGVTVIEEPELTRDHTERFLQLIGARCIRKGRRLYCEPCESLQPFSLTVPGDISSAAFFMVAASIAAGSDIVLKEVGVNPTRDGVIKILRAMGADIRVMRERCLGNEPVADIRVRSANLHGITIPAEWVSQAIDEFPCLFIAFAAAKGKTILTGAKELRVKESDRIAVMADVLNTFGVSVAVQDDGAIIEGGTLRGGEVQTKMDHRIAMAASIAGFVSEGPITVHDCEHVATSFPSFAHLMREGGLRIKTLN